LISIFQAKKYFFIDFYSVGSGLKPDRGNKSAATKISTCFPDDYLQYMMGRSGFGLIFCNSSGAKINVHFL